MNKPTVIIPYLFFSEVQELVQKLSYNFDIPFLLEQDESRIGSDLMYQKMWKMCSETDVIILHSDMMPLPEDITNQWYEEFIEFAEAYPEAGILGSKLLYPSKLDGFYVIQHAGGKFTNGRPDHFGSGLDLYSNQRFKELEVDKGQYNNVREVAWATFGGIYIRREVINTIGDFDSRYTWSYNRDVDYCLRVRKAGWKIYQTPISLLHFESRDNKRIRDNIKNQAEQQNLKTLIDLWGDTDYYKTINTEIEWRL